MNFSFLQNSFKALWKEGTFFLLRSGSNPFTKGERLTFLCLKEKLQKKQTSVPLDRRCGVDFVTKAR